MAIKDPLLELIVREFQLKQTAGVTQQSNANNPDNETDQKARIEEEQRKIEESKKFEGLTIDNIAKRIADVMEISEREARNLILFIDFAMWLKNPDDKGNLQPTSFAKKYSIKTLTDLGNWILSAYNKLRDENDEIRADFFKTNYKDLQNTVIPRASAWIYITFMIFQREEFADSEDPRLAMFAQSYISGTSFTNRRFATILSKPYKFIAVLRELDKQGRKIYELIHEYVNQQTFNPKKDED